MSASKSSAEEFGREVYKKAVVEVRDSVPRIMINIAIAVLTLVVGNYVFLPISQGYFIQAVAVTQLINLIILVALLAILLMILKELRDLADVAAGVAAFEFGSRKAEVARRSWTTTRPPFTACSMYSWQQQLFSS